MPDRLAGDQDRQTPITAPVQVSWRTVGRVRERVVASELEPSRFDGLVVDVQVIDRVVGGVFKLPTGGR